MVRLRLKSAAIVMLASMLILVSACSSSKAPKSSEPAPTQTQTDQSKGQAIDYLGKYTPDIEVTTVRAIDSTFKYADGDSIDSNVWTKEIENQLGIKVKNLWVVNTAQLQEKMNVTIASNSLPDIIPVDINQLQKLVDGDLVMDLKPLYDKYASPLTKKVLGANEGLSLASATYKGKLMALPIVNGGMDQAPVLWIRTDWLRKLNLPEPKTMADVLKISEAFTTQDPDGDKKADTFGLAVTKDVTTGGFGQLTGFFSGYHAYPQIWIKDASGKLVYGSIQPNVKQALQQLQQLYKLGQIDKEFGVKDWAKVGEDVVAGKLGMEYGAMWNPLNPLQKQRDADPNADWQAYPLVSIDSQSARPIGGPLAKGYYAVKKGAKNPEAVIKLLNLFLEKQYGKTADPSVYATTKDGIQVFKYPAVSSLTATANLDAHLNIIQALKTKDSSKLIPAELVNYNNILSFQKGDNKQWGIARVFGEMSSYSVINNYVNDKLIISNEFTGAPTPTMVERNATLNKLELEAFTKIIMGAPIDEFDQFVSDWKKLGGDAITKEVNDWYAKK